MEYFPAFNTLQLSEEVKSLLDRLGETPENSQEEFYLCRCPTTFPVEQKAMKKNVWQMLDSYLCMQEDLEKDNGHSLVLVLRKSGTLSVKTVHKESGTKLQKGCCWNSLRADVQFSVLRLHCPEVNSKAKDMENCRNTMQQTRERLRLFFAQLLLQTSSVFTEAVAEICEEYESLHERTGQPVVGGQSSSSFVLSVIKTEVPLDCDDPAYQNLLLQQYGERIEKLSQQDKLSKFCMNAGFLSVVEDGQCFMMKDTGDLTQFHAVACREYTLPREDEASQPKGWIQGNTKIGPELEVATSYLHCKYGVEIRIWSLNKDSWVRISHGSNKFVMNSNNNGTEIPEDQLEEYALKMNAQAFACRSKATAKPQRREPAGSSPRIVSIGRRNWIDIEPGKIFFLRV